MIGLTKAEIESAISRAQGRKGPQIELIDAREPGLRFRAGERSAKWSLLIRLWNGQRSRIKLGSWPGLGISEARKAARDVRRRVEEGANPNEEKRSVAREAQLLARRRRSLTQVLDEYESAVLAHHRRGAQTRRALDGAQGLLRDLSRRDPTSITRTDIMDLVKARARKSPISANRQLAYASAFFNWCVAEEMIAANPAAGIKKPGRETHRDRYHSLSELREIWQAADTLGLSVRSSLQAAHCAAHASRGDCRDADLRVGSRCRGSGVDSASCPNEASQRASRAIVALGLLDNQGSAGRRRAARRLPIRVQHHRRHFDFGLHEGKAAA